jgi:hypothetical protein
MWIQQESSTDLACPVSGLENGRGYLAMALSPPPQGEIIVINHHKSI